MITFGYNNKFSTALRALAAIGIGLVMVFSTEATVNVVKIIAAFLFAAGMVSLGYGFAHRKSGAMALMSVNAVVDIVIGLLLFCFPNVVAGAIVTITNCPSASVIQIIAVQSFLGKDYERACRHFPDFLRNIRTDFHAQGFQGESRIRDKIQSGQCR